MSKDGSVNSRQVQVSGRSTVPVVRSAPTSSTAMSSASSDVDALSDGISGSALAVPPPRSLASGRGASKESPLKIAQTSKSDTTNMDSKRSKELNDKMRELRDALARERRLQQQVVSLQQLIDSLRAELNYKQQANEHLEARIKQLEDQHKEIMDKEALDHRRALTELEQKCEQLKCKETEYIQQIEQEHRRLSDLELLVQKLEKDRSELKAEKDREILARDAKLERLKQQMADSLKGNSRERQQQLDELSKHLEKVQEEADILRTQLKGVHKKDNCSNCGKLATKIGQLQSTNTANESTIKDLREQLVKCEKLLADSGQQHSSSADLHRNKTTAKHSK